MPVPTRRPQSTPSFTLSKPGSKPTSNAPSKWIMGWIDNDNPKDDEEDWSQFEVEETKLICGETREQANQNYCSKTKSDCPSGICPTGLKCFIVSGLCNEGMGSNNNQQEQEEQTGSTNIDAPMKPPTAQPSPKPSVTAPIPDDNSPVNNYGWRQQFCAKSKAELPTACITANTCETSEDCPPGTFCWAEILCGISETERPVPAPVAGAIDTPTIPTYSPTYWWTYIPTAPLNEPPAQPFDDPPTPTPSPTRFPTSQPTKFPTPQRFPIDINPPDNQQGEVEATPELYCASARSELEASCATARSCRDEPCPKGQFCFTHTCTKSSPATEETFYCASAIEELYVSCGLATKCDGSRDSCPSGQMCFPHQCEQSLDRCPLNFSGMHSSQDCKYYYECVDGIPGTTKICGIGQKFDKVRELCVSEELVDQNCYGPPISEFEEECKQGTCYCATDTAMLDDRCGLAKACSGMIDACPDGQSCLPYDCKQSLDRCPLNFIGWHSSPDCKTYYECSNGVAGDSKVCEAGLKFSKTHGVCVYDYIVDQYCYGPPIEEKEEQTDTLTCPPGFVGWQSSVGSCIEYNECRVDGSIGATYVCDEGMRFDKVRKICINAAMVNDFCYGPALPTYSPTTISPAPSPAPTFTPSSRTSRNPPLVPSVGEGGSWNGEYPWNTQQNATAPRSGNGTGIAFPPWYLGEDDSGAPRDMMAQWANILFTSLLLWNMFQWI